MQRNQAEQETTKTPRNDHQRNSIDEAAKFQQIAERTEDTNSRRYFEGLSKLSNLKANLSSLRSLNNVQPQELHQTALPESLKPDQTILLEKSRNRALIEHDSHELRAEAFQILADRYRAAGLDLQADLYDERAQMERATTRGFQSVIDAYDKKLEESGSPTVVTKEPIRPEMVQTELEAAERHLENYNSSYGKCWEHTLQVLEYQGSLQKLELGLRGGSLSTAETEQFKEAADLRNKLMRLAEKEAIGAAESYKAFRQKTQLADKAYDALNRQSPGMKSEMMGDDRSNSNGSTHSERRMNKLAVGMVVCQTLKVLDREI
jgi:hypothetical protein